MSVEWYIEFLEKVREFRTHCADAIRDADASEKSKTNTTAISRSVSSLERHWQKQFPGKPLPHGEDISRHLRIGLVIDVVDLMTRDIHDAEVKALVSLGSLSVEPGIPFVSPERLAEIKGVSGTKNFDLSRLHRLCEELNSAADKKSNISTAILVRAVLDHVPPIFGKATFPEVANNYAGTKSFQAAMKHLEESSRKIADGLLHSQVRKSESLPTETQVDFRQSLDLLLSEVVRIHRV
jgi:hypothetical protein